MAPCMIQTCLIIDIVSYEDTLLESQVVAWHWP